MSAKPMDAGGYAPRNVPMHTCDPTTPSDVEEREGIEVRTRVIFAPEA
jgi:hypothetical protein